MDSEKLKSFDIIKAIYRDYYYSYFKKGKLPNKTTLDGKGYWAMADPDLLFDFFKKISLNRYRSFIDLGSGDGLVIAIASLFTNTLGIELDENLFNDSKKLVAKINKKLKTENKFITKILKNDFLDRGFDLSKYDFIFINPDNYLYELESKLQEEMKKSAILVVMNNLYLPLNMKQKKLIKIKDVEFRVYST